MGTALKKGVLLCIYFMFPPYQFLQFPPVLLDVGCFYACQTKTPAKKTAADNATSQWDKGGRGFYETYGYNDALGFFDSDSWESRQYREAVAEGNIRPNDSGSSYQLEHMVQAIPTLKKVNEIRKGLGLNELKWSAYETAMAQACAD